MEYAIEAIKVKCSDGNAVVSSSLIISKYINRGRSWVSELEFVNSNRGECDYSLDQQQLV